MARERGGVHMIDLSQQQNKHMPSRSEDFEGTSDALDPHHSGDKRMLDRTSVIMLLYPLVNLSVIMPLSVYRVMSFAGKTGSPQALAACGSIFALGGLANAVLYTFSRLSCSSACDLRFTMLPLLKFFICDLAPSQRPSEARRPGIS